MICIIKVDIDPDLCADRGNGLRKNSKFIAQKNCNWNVCSNYTSCVSQWFLTNYTNRSRLRACWKTFAYFGRRFKVLVVLCNKNVVVCVLLNCIFFNTREILTDKLICVLKINSVKSTMNLLFLDFDHFIISSNCFENNNKMLFSLQKINFAVSKIEHNFTVYVGGVN